MGKRLLALGVVLTLMASCVSKRKITRFQHDGIDQLMVSNDFVTTFKSDDLLQITISAQNIASVVPFNIPVVSFNSANGNAVGQPQLQTYLIDSSGEIDFPILGKLKLAGLTREEAIALFKTKLDPEYVKNPTINIFIANFKVTVTGDVFKPGTFTIPNERITILEAIGLAGDLNISAQRTNVKVIREEGNKKKVFTVNLLSNKTFTSPVYYLQQNDVVYVEPNYAKIQDSAYTRNTGLFISLASVLISLLTILTR